ncbi:hypothetical protein LCGC14_1006160 [marine sediment metagenome]|uniref:Uncharacterized protein n=1 Tax=marine sediment metagenome TaxID=412755 RepID=A0A0F9QJW3_9ZZZZ
MRILLGFEVGTGKEIYVEDGHGVTTGMTQQSGKTTTLEALVQRGEVTAVAFLTKRGESGFRNQREIQPYFKEQKKVGGLIDWQYVSSILEATISEKMKLERSFIINASKGARSLEEVYQNIRKMKEKTKRGFDESIYTNLEAYFEIILPEIRRYNFANKLNLKKGFNVLNLIGMQEEMQQLVIESTLSYVLKNLRDVIVVIPEAHKFMPQGLKTPVKRTALNFIKEGAALRNFMWMDTQETTSVDKALLKQCNNWIMGYQQEKNEVKNVRENLGRTKITDEDIMSLKLGHFIASLNKVVSHVYVLPVGIDPEMGRGVAMGTIPVSEVKRILDSLKPVELIDVTYSVHPDEIEESIELEPIIQPTVSNAGMEALEERVKGLLDVVLALEKRADELEEDAEKLRYVNNELESTVASLSKEVEDHKKTIESLNQEMEPYRALALLLAQIVRPHIETISDEDLKSLEKQIADLKKVPRRRRAPPGDSTGIAWIDIWMAKLGPAEQKILTFMASRFPMEMTRSEIAIGIGLTAKGGYFNGAFNKLRKNKLVIPVDGNNFKLAENPP